MHKVKLRSKINTVRGLTLTTGQMAEACRVAPRTVSKWFDKGLLGGYKVPGSLDRRIPVEEARRFMQANNVPLGWLESVNPISLCCLVRRDPGEFEGVDPFTLGTKISTRDVTRVLFGCEDGSGASVILARRVKEESPATGVGLLLAEDSTLPEDYRRYFDAVFPAADWVAAAEWLNPPARPESRPEGP